MILEEAVKHALRIAAEEEINISSEAGIRYIAELVTQLYDSSIDEAQQELFE
jgi:membrane-bound lytic murein transglycosylase MltF